MSPEIIAVTQDQPLLADELKIIAGERNGLSSRDRESVRNSALLIDELMKSYGTLLAKLNESEAKRIATEERLREANAALAKSNVFPPLSASMRGVWVGFGG